MNNTSKIEFGWNKKRNKQPAETTISNT
jgi:hypothetical protein